MKRSLKASFEPLNNLHKFYFVILFVISVLTVALSISKAKILGIIIEKLKFNQQTSSVLMLFALILLAHALVVLIQSRLKNKYRFEIEYAYRAYSEKNMLSATLSYIRGQEEGNIITRMSSDLRMASAYLVEGLLPLIQNILLILASVVVIFTIHYQFVLYLLPIIVVSFILQIVVSKPLHPKRKQILDQFGKSTSVASDGISNYHQVKIHHLEHWLADRFEQSLEEIKKSFIKIFPLIGLFMSVGFFFSIIPLIFLMFYGSYLAGTGVIALRDFILILSVGVNITTMITTLSQNTAKLQGLRASLSRVSEIWASPKEKEAFLASPAYEWIQAEDNAICLSHISFSYNEKKQILKDFAYSFKKHKKYIILGKNGSGKSTLIGLITGLYTPDAGKISYALKREDAGLSKLREQIGVVEQNTYLLDETVENNIFIDETPAEYKNQWFQDTYFKGILNQLPQGKETFITHGGANLSGGQKRAISIARAMVKDAEIMILDEPTANVDLETAQLINQEIVRLWDKSQKTIIIITHDAHLIDIGEDVEILNFEDILNPERI